MKFPVVCILGLTLLFSSVSHASFTIASSGKARVAIVQAADATPAERHAAAELALHLKLITGAEFDVRTNGEASGAAIIVGRGALAKKLFSETDLEKFGAEEFALRTKGQYLLLAGGQPRGTIYAVDRFLQDQCGVRWWTPWATNVPHRATLRIPELNVRGKPAFEFRDPFWFSGFDPLWKSRNGANGGLRPIPPELGDCVKYKGHAHTFYPLVPPAKYFATHPEWYSLLKGKRTHEYAQLCLSNPELRDFVVERVKEWLRETPNAQIISVTQNDWAGACECDKCKAIDDAEGGPSGSMLTFVNYVAEKIEPEFPNVAVDTFAYQYTRKPPKHVKPRPNVIVRLCSIECNFREPLDHPSNATFMRDLEDWSKICKRLYVWDYTTDFKNYVNPHPNWFVLGPNVRIFQKYGVQGIFEQGAYNGYGSEMGEMRAWVLAQLLWNPQLDDRALIREFLEGYYGKAAKPIGRYMDLMYRESKDFYLACFLRKDPPHLRFEVLAEAERLWQQAEKAVAKDPELLARVKLGHLPVRYAVLSRWVALRQECWEQNGKWPLAESRKVVAEEFKNVCAGVPGKDWTVVRSLAEHGVTMDSFLKSLETDPPEEKLQMPPKRLKNPAPPADVPREELKGAVDLQDDVASLAKRGQWAEIMPDARASDRRAVWMPGNHSEWAFRISGKDIPTSPTGKWKVYVVVRVEKSSGAKADSMALAAGVFDGASKSYPAQVKIPVSDAGENFRSHLVGVLEPKPERDIYVSPLSNAGIKAVWVDRVYLVAAH